MSPLKGSDHVDRATLAAYARDALPPARAREVGSHVDVCEACLRALSRLCAQMDARPPRAPRRIVRLATWGSSIAAAVLLGFLLTTDRTPPAPYGLWRQQADQAYEDGRWAEAEPLLQRLAEAGASDRITPDFMPPYRLCVIRLGKMDLEGALAAATLARDAAARGRGPDSDALGAVHVGMNLLMSRVLVLLGRRDEAEDSERIAREQAAAIHDPVQANEARKRLASFRLWLDFQGPVEPVAVREHARALVAVGDERRQLVGDAVIETDIDARTEAARALIHSWICFGEGEDLQEARVVVQPLRHRLGDPANPLLAAWRAETTALIDLASALERQASIRSEHAERFLFAVYLYDRAAGRRYELAGPQRNLAVALALAGHPAEAALAFDRAEASAAGNADERALTLAARLALLGSDADREQVLERILPETGWMTRHLVERWRSGALVSGRGLAIAQFGPTGGLAYDPSRQPQTQ